MERSRSTASASPARATAACYGGARPRTVRADRQEIGLMRTRVAKKGAVMASPAIEPVTACTPSKRLTSLPTYVFAWLDELKATARRRGSKLIDLGIGNPDRPTPKLVTDAIAAAYADPKTH